MKGLVCIAAMAASAALASPSAAQIATHSKAPVDIVADNLETLNSGCEAIWRGNAEALQETSRLRADVIRVFTKVTPKSAAPTKAGATSSGCGEMERIEAEGSVYYVNGDQKVRANNAVYEAGSTVITMTGDVVSVRGQNVLRGDKMIFNTDTGAGQVMGTATGRGAKDRPRGVFYPSQSASTSDKPK